jgi:hypothetical protein
MSLTEAQKEKVEEIVKKHTEREKRKQEKEAKQLFRVVLHFTSFPLLFGFIAALGFYHYYGFDALRRTVLSWTIGITLIATLYTTFINKLKNLSS